MIVIHVDTMEDTGNLMKAYEGLDNLTLLYNPTHDEVVEELTHNDDSVVMGLGHGTAEGLLGVNMSGYAIDDSLAGLLKDRKMIGIWCYASEFGKYHHLHGFFTSMFISNWDEAYSLGFPENTNEDILNEESIFCEKINALLKEGIPMNQWESLLYSSCHSEKDFVRFNYEGMKYFEWHNNIEVI